MKIEREVMDTVLTADSKALATKGRHGLNVVPVSTVYIVDHKIWLINYFMGKTLENISDEKLAALVCWKGMVGHQIKGTIEYVEEGKDFEEARVAVAKILPDRIVKGLLILSPKEIHSVSPSAK